jgi:hypothetical protein
MCQKQLVLSSILIALFFSSCSQKYEILWRGDDSISSEVVFTFENNISPNRSEKKITIIPGVTNSFRIPEDYLLVSIERESGYKIFTFPREFVQSESSIEIYVIPTVKPKIENGIFICSEIQDAIAYSVNFEDEDKLNCIVSRDNRLIGTEVKDLTHISDTLDKISENDYWYIDESIPVSYLDLPECGYVFISTIANSILWY